MRTRSSGPLLVLGASSDIGLSLLRLLPRNLTVLAHHNSSLSKLTATASDLPGLEVIPLRADLTSLDGTRGLIEELDRHPSPSAVVHLAAPRLRSLRFRQSSWGDFATELDVQLRSVVMVLSNVLPRMVQDGGGRIVFVLTSANWNVPPVGMAPYVVAKSALLGLARCLAAEYGPRRINVNSVSPSLVETAFLSNFPERYVEIAAGQSPSGRNAKPEDVAKAIGFLLADESEFISGADLPVTGGSVF